MRLKDKVCIITGGGSGIGRATALLFADEGARLVVADKRNAQAVGAECAGKGAQAIAPGTIDTPYFNEILTKSADPEAARKALAARQLLGRLGTAEEIAAGILFLASDESRFATGTILTLDGGMTAQ